VGAWAGVPLVDAHGRAVGALVVADPHPRAWDARDVALLEHLAASAAADQEVAALTREHEASRLRWSLAVEAAGIGGFDWDLRTGRLQWDDRLLALFGHDADSFDETIEGFNTRLHPDDVERVGRLVQVAIDTCSGYEAEYRVVLPGGAVRRVQARGRVLGDEDGVAVRMLGAAFDTTAAHDLGTRVVRVLETMSAAFYLLDGDWCFSYVNAEAERLLGRGRGELLGGSLWELFPGTVGTVFETAYRTAVRTGEPAAFEAYYPAPLDGWFEVRAWPGPEGLSVYFLDISDRRRASEEALRGTRRLELLSEASAQLSATLDVEEAVARLAQIVVPVLADWCVVTLVDDDGRLRDVGWWHADPAERRWVEQYVGSRLDGIGQHSLIAAALSTGEPALVDADATAVVHDMIVSPDARAVLARLAPESAAVLPLRARGGTVGLLSLFRGPDRAALAGADLVTAREVAERAGLALDNARLYDRQRRMAEELQRSLLTAPPEPDHLQIVVRYEPAAHQAQVGGDWYDAFLQPDGATVLVIGDVVGHDTAAAAAMGQLRGLLRGIAYTSEQGPSAVLTRLDAAMQGLQVATTATAAVARLEQEPAERERGVTRLRWSSAGHPPPMVVSADGSVEVLAGARADLMLGIDPATPRAEAQVVLERGTTLLLYTDGLVERRGQSLDEGIEVLRATLAEVGSRSLDELCDTVLSRLLPDEPEDDVALVAVRLHVEEGPRPAEAGPERVPPHLPRP
jgi:serine phosphatase RsbU (regulator of sigma subunit)/PAS domain-containing protein